MILLSTVLWIVERAIQHVGSTEPGGWSVAGVPNMMANDIEPFKV